MIRIRFELEAIQEYSESFSQDLGIKAISNNYLEKAAVYIMNLLVPIEEVPCQSENDCADNGGATHE